MFKNFVYSLSIFFLVVLITFLSVEGVLRFSGWAYLRIQDVHNRGELSESKEYRILCIGESTTALGGEDSYPSQLEEILNQENNGVKFRVINKGIPGQGATNILPQVEGWIEKFKPQLIVAMLGINDQSSHLPLNAAYIPTNSFWSHFKTAKLVKWLYSSLTLKVKMVFSPKETMNDVNGQSIKLVSGDNLGTGRPQKSSFDSEEDIKRVVLFNKLLTEKNYPAAEQFLLYYQDNFESQGKLKEFLDTNFTEIYLVQNQYDKLVKLIQSRAINPYDFFVNELVVRACRQGGVDEMIGLVRSLVEQHGEEFAYSQLISNCYEVGGRSKEAAFYKHQAEKIFSSSIDPRNLSNLQFLIEKTKKYAVQLIIMQYPRRSVGPIQAALGGDSYVRSIMFVENKINFENALKKKSYDDLFTDRFAGDFGHATRLGNYLIADNLATEIKKIVR